ncbi:hypothetical protein [Streptomyces noursei]|uniref:hypothetical protein n=1 Tax=Streptomyces noursei TaxID=1971 RepID=UPI0016764AA4|nr:hypothetical protein [Streptomyces noursei]MCZ1016318.1 hypothetical protein [Streptomyces noursei]GGX00580.1 hypothetical protein GCM10010341_22900 [Streptomyces noursei]
MPENTHTLRRCPDCDGFPRVAITTGQRTHTGSRHTVKVTCRTCNGNGLVPRRATAAAQGR